MDHSDLETALAITPRFYPAALDFDLWPEVLRDLNADFASRIAQLNLMGICHVDRDVRGRACARLLGGDDLAPPGERL